MRIFSDTNNMSSLYTFLTITDSLLVPTVIIWILPIHLTTTAANNTLYYLMGNAFFSTIGKLQYVDIYQTCYWKRIVTSLIFVSFGSFSKHSRVLLFHLKVEEKKHLNILIYKKVSVVSV